MSNFNHYPLDIQLVGDKAFITSAPGETPEAIMQAVAEAADEVANHDIVIVTGDPVHIAAIAFALASFAERLSVNGSRVL